MLRSKINDVKDMLKNLSADGYESEPIFVHIMSNATFDKDDFTAVISHSGDDPIEFKRIDNEPLAVTLERMSKEIYGVGERFNHYPYSLKFT